MMIHAFSGWIKCNRHFNQIKVLI